MMATTNTDDSNGLMAFWADIDADYVLRYQQWHNCEHVPERVSIPGFLKGRRYRSMSDAPHFLMFYDTTAPSVLASDAYMAALNAPTPWTREALTHFRKPIRGIYAKLAVSGSSSPRTAAPYLVSLRFDLPGESEAEAAYATSWVQAASQAEGVQRVRFYRADAATGNLATSERKIYGGGPGKQVYLVLIELSTPPSQDRVQDPVSRADAAVGAAASRANEEYNAYWLEFAYEAKGAA